MKIFCLTIAITLVSLTRAHGYGPIGHQIVGAVADERLADTLAGAKVHQLLDGMTLEKAAIIPDEIRGWDKTGADDPNIFHYTSRPRIDAQLRDFWKANPPTHDQNSAVPSHHWFHYTDVPILSSGNYGDGKIGRSQWDIVHAMRYCIAVLKGDQPEENARKVTKPIAIILLAHFVGDIHQPLHVGAEFFNNSGEPVDPEHSAEALEDQGGNSITLKHSPAAARKIGHAQTKFHGFWDEETVHANLPQLPEDLPKEERRTRMEEASKALVQQFVRQEPPDWRLPSRVPLLDYPEAWANEILPIAREAHARLRFNVHAQEEKYGTFAVGEAEGKETDDKISYEDWSAGIVRNELHKAGWRLADLLEQALK